MLSRRNVVTGAAGAAGFLAVGGYRGHARAADEPPLLDPGLAQGVKDSATLEALPGKAPLIKLSYRPPNYETPISYLDKPITPNDAFFVRYHLADIPEKIDADRWRLAVGGEGVERPFDLSLAELQALPAVELTAVLQCSGARRGLVEPHVPGVQWGYGAIGAARWKGARVKDILARAGVRKETVEIVADGADGPVLDKTPKFTKSIPLSKALDDNALVAYAMNGEPLPHFNGFPARLVVPGWTGTYWMKHLTSLNAVTKPLANYWMASAYRLPNGKFAFAQHFTSQENDVNTPITEMLVNSLATSPANGARLPRGQRVEVKGLAWDAGYGVAAVEVSSDGGATFSQAALGEDLGRFAFRPFSFVFTPLSAGKLMIIVNARNRIGQTQTSELIPNPGGYHHNLTPRLTIEIV
jgi:DMSO/TMAO reductase YedYZ molybdopterin-dependent catalytic subunit